MVFRSYQSLDWIGQGRKRQGCLDWIDRGRERRKRWLKFWKSEEHVRERTFFSFHSKLDLSSTNQDKQKFFYKNFKIFDQSRTGFNQSKKKRFDWSSANQGSIKPSRTKFKKFKEFSISRKTHSIDRNFGKIEFLKNSKIFIHKTLKPIDFMNEMHEYEFKSFSKTLAFNPELPKTRLWHNLSPNFNQWTYFVSKSKNI